MAYTFSVAAAAAVLTIVSATAPAAAEPFQAASTITIRADAGGQMVRYAMRVKQIQKSGRDVRFAGRCDSACTLHLALPKSKTCIAPGASFGFHMPYGSTSQGNAVAANYMMRKYPSWVRTWLASHGGLTRSIKRMPYTYAARYLPKCPTTTARLWF